MKSRLGSRGRLIPGWLFAPLERLIRQNELNALLAAGDGLTGSAFADSTLRHLDITLNVTGLDSIDKSGRYLFVSNHPLGGLDGITLIKILGEYFGDDHIRFMVNDMLMNVEPLRPVFIPVNKYGNQQRGAAGAIAATYASDAQMLIFPAGLVSRLHDDGSISDLEWHKAFVAKAVQYHRDVVPIHFEALNSMMFYRIARLRKKSGLRVNIEQALLPSELCKARGRNFSIIFGDPIPWQTLKERKERGESFPQIAASVRSLVYEMKSAHEY